MQDRVEYIKSLGFEIEESSNDLTYFNKGKYRIMLNNVAGGFGIFDYTSDSPTVYVGMDLDKIKELT